MTAVDEILSRIDPAQLAAALGTDEQTARAAAATAIPTLITGFQANAATPEGEAGLRAALGRHAGDGGDGDRVDLDAVDTADGRKIVAHALADDPSRLQALGGLDGNLLARLLPLLAPIVFSYLARKFGSGAPQPGGSGGGLGDLLGGLLGGALGGDGGGGLGDLLGGAPGGRAPTTPGPDAGPAAGTGPVFTSPGNSTGLRIPIGDEPATPPDQQRQGGGLGDLLGQILGR